MRVGLIDVDGHNFPNYALMKVHKYYKESRHLVEWVREGGIYDKVYQSKVFTFTEDTKIDTGCSDVIKGGTGYSMYEDLFCDGVEPDYSLYPQYEHAYGFITRGCTRKCSWCVVPKKEGLIRPYRDIETILQGRKTAILMDNNVLASAYGLSQMEKITNIKCKVDFNQGLDSRLVTDDVAKLLSKIKWIKYIRFACDQASAVEPLLKAVEKLNRHGVKNYRIFVYLLVKEVEETNNRCEILKKLGVNPFAQPFRDFINNTPITEEQRKFARYVNHKAIFKSTNWENYRSSIKRRRAKQLYLFDI